MITIEVGRAGIKVYISASTGFLGTGGVREAITDSKGNAYINFDDYGSTFNGEVFVAGNSIYKGRINVNDIYSV